MPGSIVQRYKICEFHSRLPKMLIDDRCVRFCQQCGRFQDLDEFDGNKKSCREKLKLHNAQRKKKRDGIQGKAGTQAPLDKISPPLEAPAQQADQNQELAARPRTVTLTTDALKTHTSPFMGEVSLMSQGGTPRNAESAPKFLSGISLPETIPESPKASEEPKEGIWELDEDIFDGMNIDALLEVFDDPPKRTVMDCAKLATAGEAKSTQLSAQQPLGSTQQVSGVLPECPAAVSPTTVAHPAPAPAADFSAVVATLPGLVPQTHPMLKLPSQNLLKMQQPVARCPFIDSEAFAVYGVVPAVPAGCTLLSPVMHIQDAPIMPWVPQMPLLEQSMPMALPGDIYKASIDLFNRAPSELPPAVYDVLKDSMSEPVRFISTRFIRDIL